MNGNQWTPERREILRTAYAETVNPPSLADIVARLGGVYTARQVSRAALRLGYRRDPETLAQMRRDAVRQGLARVQTYHTGEAWRAARGLPPAEPGQGAPGARGAFLGDGRGLPADVRALIDAAVAAGKVTVLPSGLAAGLSPLEQQFGTARPATEGDWREQRARHFDNLRAGARGR